MSMSSKIPLGAAHQEGGVLAETTIREDEEELGSVDRLSGSLKGMRNTGREVPEVSRALRNIRSMRM